MGWGWEATYHHFPETSPENIQQRHGGAREAGRAPVEFCWEQASPSLGTRLQGTRGLVRVSPDPVLHQLALHREGREVESSGYPELSLPPLQAPPRGLAEGGREERKEGEKRIAKEEGPGGGSLIQTGHC